MTEQHAASPPPSPRRCSPPRTAACATYVVHRVRQRRRRLRHPEGQDHGRRHRQGHLPAGDAHRAARLLQGRRRRRRPDDRAVRRQAENVLVAGKVQGVVGFYDHTVDAADQGQVLESVVQLAKVPGEAEVVSTKAGRVRRGCRRLQGQEARGHLPGSSTDFLTQYLAKKNGIDSDEYTTVTAGAGSTFIAALQNGGIDAGMTTDPTIATARRQGPRQGDDRHAHRGGHQGGARRPLPGRVACT